MKTAWKPENLELDPRDLRAAALFVSKDKYRAGMEGVSVEYLDGAVYVVATDGHRLLCIRRSTTAQYQENGSIILPADLIAKACKPVPKSKSNPVPDVVLLSIRQLENNGSRIILRRPATGAEFSEWPIDGQFPNWRSIVPSAATFNLEEPAPFAVNMSYLGTLADVSAIFGQKDNYGWSLEVRSPNSAILAKPFAPLDGATAFALVMPLRADGEWPSRVASRISSSLEPITV